MAENIKLGIIGATGPAGISAVKHLDYLNSISKQYADLLIITAGPDSKDQTLGNRITEKEEKAALLYGRENGKYGRFWTPVECHGDFSNMIISPTDADLIAEKADYVISAVGSDVAKKIEPELLKRGVHVISNASYGRWLEDVGLLIPGVNSDAINSIHNQTTPGKHICNPNCTSAGFVPLIMALIDLQYNVKHINLVTQQAMSGKGYDILDEEKYAKKYLHSGCWDDWTDKNGFNAEAYKTMSEPMKILGLVNTIEQFETNFKAYQKGESHNIIPIVPSTTRVPRQDGHIEHLTITFDKPVDAKQIEKQLAEYKVSDEIKYLPTAPDKWFYIEQRMPQPDIDLANGHGMGITVGQIRQMGPNTIAVTTLSNNVVLGATGAGIMGLELLLQKQNKFDWKTKES